MLTKKRFNFFSETIRKETSITIYISWSYSLINALVQNKKKIKAQSPVFQIIFNFVERKLLILRASLYYVLKQFSPIYKKASELDELHKN